MQAKDVMTTNVITVGTEASVIDIAELLLKHRISAVPVVGANGHLVGIVSEGDLMRRREIETDKRQSWWLAELFATKNAAADYVKTHGRKASDVMTQSVVSVTPDASLAEIAGLLERHHIKRVPVLEDQKLVGIVSRANLLQAFASRGQHQEQAAPPADSIIREKVMTEIREATGGYDAPLINATVSEGVVSLWGLAQSEDTIKAAEVAAQNVSGVRRVENHLGHVQPWVYSA